MKIGVYDPYLDSLGGGERYVLTLAELLSEKEEIEIFWNDGNIKESIENRLNLRMDKVKFVDNIFTRDKNLLQKLILTRKYDIIFFLSDGSIPTIFSKTGILHFQVPFKHISRQTLINKIKLTRFQKVVCNSQFTKKFIDKTYGVNSLVIYPPVDLGSFKPQLKKNIILNIGRYTKSLHNKKQEILIDAFKEIFSKTKEWELVLAGGVMPEDKNYVEELRSKAGGLPIKISTNISFAELKTLYGQAKIYWHAAGFGEDEENHPERMEHFGITTVEAMSAGCVPVVFAGGGQKEIVDNEDSGFLWKDIEKLKTQTLTLIKDEKIREEIALKAQDRSKDFSREKFCRSLNEIIYC